jgi:two-component system, NtrC family, nitrogen regulation sensor histidine kinase NtrY
LRPILRNVLYKNAYLLIAAAWLFTISIIIANTSIGASPSSIRHSVEEFTQQQEKDFISLTADTNLINSLYAANYTATKLQWLVDKPYGVFLCQPENGIGHQLLFWNGVYAKPPDSLVHFYNSNGMVQLSNGYYAYINRTVKTSRTDTLVMMALIPLHWQYPFTNKYLRNTFVADEDFNRKAVFSQTPTALPVNSVFGKPLFYMEPREELSYSGGYHDWLSLVLRVLASLLIFFFVHQVADAIARNHSTFRGILFLTGAILALRILTYFTPIPIQFQRYELFDPSIFASGYINKSLGDLLINAIIFLWVVLFTRQHLKRYDRVKLISNDWLRWAITGLLLFMLLEMTFVSGNVIRTMVSDSKVSFDVIDFFSLSRYTVVGFVVLSCIAMGYFFLSQILFRLVRPIFDQSPGMFYLLLASLGLLLLFVQLGKTGGLTGEMLMLIWLLLYLRLLDIRRLDVNKFNYSIGTTIFWIFIFTASISGLIITENKGQEERNRRKKAERLVMQLDENSAYMLNIAMKELSPDFLAANFSLFANRDSGAALRSKLAYYVERLFPNSFRYDLLVYDGQGTPLFNNDSTSLNSIIATFTNKGRPIKPQEPEQVMIEESYDRFSYLGSKKYYDTSGNIQGHIFVRLQSKKAHTEALQPELFKPTGGGKTEEESNRIAYAVYNNTKLVESKGDYPFPIEIPLSQYPRYDDSERVNNGFHEIWYKAGTRLSIVTRRDSLLIEAATLFAYLFCAFIFVAILFRIFSLLLRSRFRWSVLREQLQFNIRTQIYNTIILISLISFVIIGYSTIRFFIKRYEYNNSEMLGKTISVLSSDISRELQTYNEYDDGMQIYESGPGGYLNKLISRVADAHGADINMYDINGNLVAYSQDMVYNEQTGVLTDKMNPIALYHMKQLQEINFVQEEELAGELKYLSMYMPVRDQSGEVRFFINMPSFYTQRNLKQEISNFLVTIINLNAFIFLIAGLLALVVTNRITNSFTFISEKMRQINLEQINEEIDWQKNDEIGGLVREYNKMVKKLEVSAAIMAKTEREGAWREMARQVAHEIKNPLTPMKLSIQYLQKSIDNNSPNVKELSSSVAHTLIEQIEHLSKIAADFSQFANIGNTKNELFDLHEILRSLIALYEPNEGLQIEWTALPQRLPVLADKTQMNRLFTNLLQNAVEACGDKGHCTIQIGEKLSEGKVIVSIRDNGDGIPPDMQSKIFTPNFTTKTSGTGLGLAMCRSITEQAHGDIWFETTQGSGTVFFVALPMIETETG